MGYTASFLPNEIYGAAHINKITERLTGQGVNPVLVDGNNYSSGELSKITNYIAGEGLTYNENSCRVIKYSETQFKILYGSAFFDDGTTIDVDSSGVLLNILSGKNYIYFKKGDSLNAPKPVASSNPPTSSDIPLAEYDGEEVNDKREYAKSRIAENGNIGNFVFYDYSSALHDSYENLGRGEWRVAKEISMKDTRHTKVFLSLCRDPQDHLHEHHMRGGFFGEWDGSNSKMLWTGGAVSIADVQQRQTIINGAMGPGCSQDVVSIAGAMPFINCWNSTSYLQFDCKFSNGKIKFLLKMMKTNNAYTIAAEDVKLFMC